MLPTCIGISGVSRYRNDASSDESFLASPMISSRNFLPKLVTRRLLRRFWRSDDRRGQRRRSGLCIFRGRICNGKGARPVKLLELAFFCQRQAVGDGPKGRGIDAEADMA